MKSIIISFICLALSVVILIAGFSGCGIKAGEGGDSTLTGNSSVDAATAEPQHY